MRRQILKLTKRHSTKAERRFLEILKRNHIPFKTKVNIKGREIDFLIGTYAIEIDSHVQDVTKNTLLLQEGYNPIHFTSKGIDSPFIEEWLKQICQVQVQGQVYSPHIQRSQTSTQD